MPQKHTRGYVILAVLLALNLAATGVTLGLVLGDRVQAANLQEKYVLYIGTNDKDTGLPELPLEECKAIVTRACAQTVSGFTLAEAEGAWKDDAEAVVNERTLICNLNGATEAEATAIAEQAMRELDQRSVLIERQSLRYWLYRK